MFTICKLFWVRKNIYKYSYSTKYVHISKSDLHVYMIMLEIEGDSELELLRKLPFTILSIKMRRACFLRFCKVGQCSLTSILVILTL